MKRFIATLTLFASMIALSHAGSASAGQQSGAGARSEDEAAIRRIVGRLQDGWNAGDGKAFAAPFAADADYVVINGMAIKGRDSIGAGHQHIFDTIYKNSNIQAAIRSIRFIRDDVAVAHIKWTLKLGGSGAAQEGNAMNTMVLTREGGQWSIVSFQNTSIQAGQR